MKDIQEQLFAIFQAEHAEHLEHIRSLVALLETVGNEAGKAHLDEAFRRAHSLKGAARAVDIQPVEGIASRLETLFAKVREGALPLDQDAARTIHQLLDSSEDCLQALRGNHAPDVGGGPPPTAEEASFQPLEMVRLPGESLDRLVRSVGQVLSESLRQKSVTEELTALGREVAAMEAECSKLRNSAAGSLRALEGKPEFAAMVCHIGYVEQTVRAVGSRLRSARMLQQRSAWNMRVSADQLQRDTWSARMAPAEDLFEGFRKMVRDLARDQQKEIDFRLSGSGVKADRAVLQALKDPVMHLLRNAISHGLEPPAERTGKGKSAAGSLTLHLNSQRGRLLVEVEDDGRGVDFARVAQVAAERGFVSPDESGAIAPQELARVLFRAGFSTSATVNDLSGRGMGLSVVYETVQRLQGEVDLRPKEGPGTAIVLSVPLSVSSHHLLLVASRGQTFGIPTHGIERLFRIKLDRIETVEGKPVVEVDGRRIALFSLAALLQMEEGLPEFEGDVLPVMVLKSGTRRVAVWVDRFSGERDALIQDLGMPSPATVSGGVLLREGSVVVVLNPAGLMESCVQSSPAPAPKSASVTTALAAAGILVVDDSITTRSLEKSILETHGYRVRVAVDGMDALQQLRTEKADLIISDIQMPRLDGFGLLEALRADKEFAGIPVIIVSSLENAEDQQRGLLLGADAYVVKQKFDQTELLEAIRQIL